MKISSVLPGKGGGDSGGDGEGDGSRHKPNVRRSNYTLVGTVVVSLFVIGLLVGATKPEWQQYFNFGFTTREVVTPGDYFTLANTSKVKLGGVEVGRIDSLEENGDGTGTFTVRLQSDVVDKVGSAPSANLRPTTLLGGIVYMDLLPGGDRTQPWVDAIPAERTRLPVEVSPVVQAIQPDAVKGIPAGINGLEGALSSGATEGLKRLARDAPAALGPGAGVINSLTGKNPGTDLPAVVDGFQRTTAVLNRKDGQIESILRDLRATTRAFADSSPAASEAVRRLPAALDTARPGLARLSVTLDKLKATAGPARPTVQELDKLLQRLDPVLVKARPVVNDLRFAAQETRPLVQSLIPASRDLRFVFDNLNDPLDRVNGPLVDALESGFNPTDDLGPGAPGPLGNPVVSKTEYTADTGRRHSAVPSPNAASKLRQEIGPALRGFDGASGYFDANGSGVSFTAGVGSGSIPNLNLPTLVQLFAQLGVLTPPSMAAAGPLGALPVPGLPVPGLPVANPRAGAPGAPLPTPAVPGGRLTGGPTG